MVSTGKPTARIAVEYTTKTDCILTAATATERRVQGRSGQAVRGPTWREWSSQAATSTGKGGRCAMARRHCLHTAAARARALLLTRRISTRSSTTSGKSPIPLVGPACPPPGVRTHKKTSWDHWGEQRMKEGEGSWTKVGMWGSSNNISNDKQLSVVTRIQVQLVVGMVRGFSHQPPWPRRGPQCCAEIRAEAGNALLAVAQFPEKRRDRSYQGLVVSWGSALSKLWTRCAHTLMWNAAASL